MNPVLNPPESATLKAALQNFLKKGIPLPSKSAIAGAVIMLTCFFFLGYEVNTQADWVAEFNATIAGSVQSLRTNELNPWVIMLTSLGNPTSVIIMVILIASLLGFLRHWDDDIFFTGNLIGAVVLVQVLKLCYTIERPTENLLIARPESFSFPSAHSACCLIMCCLVALLIIRALRAHQLSVGLEVLTWIVFIAIGLSIGISRIYVGVHWPTDVLGGWLIAATWLFPTITWYLSQYPRSRFGLPHAQHEEYPVLP